MIQSRYASLKPVVRVVNQKKNITMVKGEDLVSVDICFGSQSATDSEDGDDNDNA